MPSDASAGRLDATASDAACVAEDRAAAALLSWLQAWLGPGGQVAVARYAAESVDFSGLFPDEVALVDTAVAQRQAEFIAGRRCAHRVMTALGLPRQPLLRGQQRQPLWPAGMVGSLSHDGGLSVAIGRRVATESGAAEKGEAAREAAGTKMGGLGVDVMPDSRRVGDDLQRFILAPGEEAMVGQVGMAVLFSIKEAALKAISPVAEAWLPFTDIAVVVSGPDFTAMHPSLPAGIRGSWQWLPGFLVAAARWP